jgi:hypothetical protein
LPIASQVAELTAAVERAGATCDVVQDAGISGTDLEAVAAGGPATDEGVSRLDSAYEWLRR